MSVNAGLSVSVPALEACRFMSVGLSCELSDGIPTYNLGSRYGRVRKIERHLVGKAAGDSDQAISAIDGLSLIGLQAT